MKRIVTIIGLMLVTALARAEYWTNYPALIPNPSDTFLFAALPDANGNPTNAQIAATNLAKWFNTNVIYAHVSNPLGAGGINYTTPPIRGYLTLNMVVTNSGVALLTNLTTTSYQMCGSLNSTGTNYDSYYMRTSPSDIIQFTNKTVAASSGVGILSSHWNP